MADYITHKSVEGERWDSLALRYYRNVAKQSALIAANRGLFRGLAVPAVLPAGLSLRVPLIEAAPATENDLLPPWKR